MENKPISLNVDRIRQEMAERGWNQTDLCRATGIAATTISRRLNGHVTSITGATLSRFSNALGLHVSELIK